MDQWQSDDGFAWAVQQISASTVVVRFTGDLDPDVADRAREALTAAVGLGTAEVVVDATGLDLITGCGLGILATAADELRRRGGVLAVAGGSPLVVRLVRLTALDLVLDLRPPLDAAGHG